jgi:hypothetical protein
MRARGKSILRPYSPEERAATLQRAQALGLNAKEALAQLRDQAADVYLKDVVCS